ncbi:MAG: Malate dehydrogenase (Oxaloacetate-decarboxylating) [Parcubacteria group bacterium GW2011_GWA1_47_11]|nr:MAG: Malate dehydrogenase (Oxaloacetate-decarboxylating) [Parcubacteria group bacterium GW2011_GWA1_47_11]
MEDIDKEALELHKRYGGKLTVNSKVPLKNRQDLSLAYTPGVAAVCQEIFKDRDLAKVYTIKKNTVAVITDGSAILGLGNLGPLAALPVMEGKCALFKEFADVDAFPICLNTEDTEAIIDTIKYIAPVFGGINLEDISAPRCFEIERRLKEELDIPVMHDDQHGTAVVVLAGLINALLLKNLSKEKARVVINGAGAAGTAITKFLNFYGRAGAPRRAGLSPEKKELAEMIDQNSPRGTLGECLLGTDIFIGVSARDVLTAEMIKQMNPEPIIFALANPYPEIAPVLAKRAGAFIIATGRSDVPNQVNNILAFPGIFRGALDNNVREITASLLIKAAENLAAYVKNPSPEFILPDPLDKEVAKVIAMAIKS